MQIYNQIVVYSNKNRQSWTQNKFNTRRLLQLAPCSHSFCIIFPSSIFGYILTSFRNLRLSWTNKYSDLALAGITAQFKSLQFKYWAMMQEFSDVFYFWLFCQFPTFSCLIWEVCVLSMNKLKPEAPFTNTCIVVRGSWCKSPQISHFFKALPFGYEK